MTLFTFTISVLFAGAGLGAFLALAIHHINSQPHPPDWREVARRHENENATR